MSSIGTIEDWWSLLNEKWNEILEIVKHNLPGIDVNQLDKLRILRDPTVHSYLNTAWSVAPETYAWTVPGWGYFCDLCSEDWVFNSEK